MRKLKFRAWDSKEKNFVCFGLIAGLLAECDSTYIKNYIHLGKIEQYTGLKDKNGKEIYEGDIVQRTELHNDYYPEQFMPRIKEHPKTKEWEEVRTGVISLDPNVRFNSELLTRLRTKESLAERELCDEYDYVVIGNIHENPELLEIK